MKKYKLIDKIVIIVLLFHCLIIPIFIISERHENLFILLYSIFVFFCTIYYIAEQRYK